MRRKRRVYQCLKRVTCMPRGQEALTGVREGKWGGEGSEKYKIYIITGGNHDRGAFSHFG